MPWPKDPEDEDTIGILAALIVLVLAGMFVSYLVGGVCQ